MPAFKHSHTIHDICIIDVYILCVYRYKRIHIDASPPSPVQEQTTDLKQMAEAIKKLPQYQELLAKYEREREREREREAEGD